MVDLQRGEFHKTDFALCSPLEATTLDINRRRKVAEANIAETETTLKAQLTPDGVPISRGDPRGLPASGTIGGALNGGPAAGTLTPVKPAPNSAGTVTKAEFHNHQRAEF
jgi:hypothetical protein